MPRRFAAATLFPPSASSASTISRFFKAVTAPSKVVSLETPGAVQRLQHFLRKKLKAQGRAAIQQHQSLHQIFKFANIARPIIFV